MPPSSAAASTDPPEPLAHTGPPPQDAPPPATARRLARWTTNLLASGLVALVGLTAGREVSTWWRTPADDPAATSAGNQPDAAFAWNFQSGFFDLTFGDSPVSLRRQSLQGDRAAARLQLRRQTADRAAARFARLASASTSPHRPRGSTAAGEAGQAADDAVSAESEDKASAERRLAAWTAQLRPAAGEPGRWALYEWDAGLPVNVAIDLRTRRTLAWGVALPAARSAPDSSPAEWSLFVWMETSSGEGGGGELERPGRSADAAPSFIEPPRPPGSRLGLSIVAPDGRAIAGFRSTDRLSDVERYFDDWGRRHDASIEAPWRQVGGLRRARYRLPSGGRATIDLDVRSNDGVRGFVTLEPARPATKE